MRSALLVVVIWIGWGPTSPWVSAADRVILRDLTILRDRTVVSLDEDGVRLDDQSLLTWDRIERATIGPQKQAEFDRLRVELGQPLYRLRLRLKVGDDAGLAEIAEPLATRFAERTGASAYLVHRALMKGRLAQGRREAAVEPYLRCLAYVWERLEGRPEIPAEQTLPFDAATGVSSELLPIWLNGDAAREALAGVRRAATQFPEPRPEGLRVYFATLALAAGDRETAERVAGQISPQSGPSGDWRDLLAVMLEPETEMIGPAVERLATRLDQLTGPVRPVAYYWTALPLLRSAQPTLRHDGILRLLHLPALYGAEQPEIAADALRRAAEAFETSGDATSATAVRGELQRISARLATPSAAPAPRAAAPSDAKPEPDPTPAPASDTK